ncbi:MAG: hypothetical protein GDA52_10875 [Rhodobacteraceae bacterium]|nr:hypothetical protein [Paracoccaceae bacterium]
MTERVEIRGGLGNDSVNTPADAPAGQGYHLRGFAGNDSLTGGAYHDWLDGDGGSDTLNGGVAVLLITTFSSSPGTGLPARSSPTLM